MATRHRVNSEVRWKKVQHERVAGEGLFAASGSPHALHPVRINAHPTIRVTTGTMSVETGHKGKISARTTVGAPLMATWHCLNSDVSWRRSTA